MAKRRSNSSQLAPQGPAASDIIQLGFNTSSQFRNVQSGLTAGGINFTTKVVKLLYAEDIAPAHIIVTPAVAPSNDQVNNGDFLEESVLVYWCINTIANAGQQLTVKRIGYSEMEHELLTVNEVAAIAEHDVADTFMITCPQQLLVLREDAAARANTQLLVPLQTIAPTAKKPKVDNSKSATSEGESVSTTSKLTKSIPDLDGQAHAVLDGKDGSIRRQTAEFMRRLLPEERQQEMGLGIEYKIDPARYKAHLSEISLRVKFLAGHEVTWLSTGGLFYIMMCDVFTDNDIWARFLMGDWTWYSVASLSLKHFNPYGSDFKILLTRKSTVVFRMSLAECFRGFERLLRTVCSPTYEHIFDEIIALLIGDDNILEGLADPFVFHICNAWAASWVKYIRNSEHPDGSMLGPANCSKYIREQVQLLITQLKKIVENSDKKLEATFFDNQLAQIQWQSSSDPKVPASKVTPKRGTPIDPTIVPESGKDSYPCWHNVASQLKLKYSNGKPIKCVRGPKCHRRHVTTANLDAAAMASLDDALIGDFMREQLRNALPK